MGDLENAAARIRDLTGWLRLQHPATGADQLYAPITVPQWEATADLLEAIARVMNDDSSDDQAADVWAILTPADALASAILNDQERT